MSFSVQVWVSSWYTSISSMQWNPSLPPSTTIFSSLLTVRTPIPWRYILVFKGDACVGDTLYRIINDFSGIQSPSTCRQDLLCTRNPGTCMWVPSLNQFGRQLLESMADRIEGKDSSFCISSANEPYFFLRYGNWAAFIQSSRNVCIASLLKIGAMVHMHNNSDWKDC